MLYVFGSRLETLASITALCPEVICEGRHPVTTESSIRKRFQETPKEVP
jgi:hypothetical protein